MSLSVSNLSLFITIYLIVLIRIYRIYGFLRPFGSFVPSVESGKAERQADYSKCHLLSNYCYYQFSGTAVISEFAEVDALPGADVQAAIGDGNGDADTA